MAEFRKAGARYQPNIARADHRDTHMNTSLVLIASSPIVADTQQHSFNYRSVSESPALSVLIAFLSVCGCFRRRPSHP